MLGMKFSTSGLRNVYECETMDWLVNLLRRTSLGLGRTGLVEPVNVVSRLNCLSLQHVV